MKPKYHFKPWEIAWQRKLRDWKDSRFGLKVIQRIPANLWSKIPYEAIPFWIASVLVGIVSVGYEKVFEIVESTSIKIFEFNPYLIFAIAPVFMFLSWYLVQRYEKNAGGSGIPQLMAAVNIAGTKNGLLVDKLLNLKIIVVKVFSSLALLLGGGAIGREGPMLQISGSIFEMVYRLIPEKWPKVSQKVMLITGGASGLAAAFNTPLGGIVYVVEELTKSHIGKFRTAVFGAVIISGLTAQLFLGSYLFLGFPKINKLPFLSLFWVAGFAFISGYLGSVFTKGISEISKLRKKVKKGSHRFLFVIGLSILFATMVFFTGSLSMGTGKHLINDILFSSEDLPWFAFPARMIGSLLSFSIGGAGGIFSTSLASGAALGHLLVNTLNFGQENHNLMVLVCMIGFLTGVTRSPFTAAILVLEMTDRHSAIFYFLLAGMVANVAANLISTRSFYAEKETEIFKDFGLRTKSKS
ncbi:chloride channel protein [Arcticibacterium luteifluviistationis]|uniref:Chloride channel protein n=1 Tax=Arcticibacterium luteifluviistationis TaxID=1784714 RepID=A0A2Z4G944_9BACT|nr:chloride channel protein [Arcticibacterium luteifluviistationis]AWV97600.1 chloride channel protein [Arcticibacterium luteifluviistationis]